MLTREELVAASLLVLAAAGPKKVATAKGSAFYHLPIGALIHSHGKPPPGQNFPAIPDHPHGWIPQAKWLEGQAAWEAIWKANEWKGHGSRHVWSHGHLFSVPGDADVWVPGGTGVKDAELADAKKIIVIGKPGEGKAAALLPDGKFEEIPLDETLLAGLHEHGKLIPDAQSPAKLAVQTEDVTHWMPAGWKAFTTGGKKPQVYAKDEQGHWHTFSAKGHHQWAKASAEQQMDEKLEAGQLKPYDHPVTHEPAAPPPTGSPTVPEVSKTTVSGIEVTQEDIAKAIELLTADKSTQVKLPLKNAGHPLVGMDYHGIAKAEIIAHPELKLAKGSKQAHVGQVKYAVLHYLAGQLTTPADDAQEAQAQAAAEEAVTAAQHSYELAPSTVMVGGVEVSAADLQGAIDALEAHPTSTAIKQILKGAKNKLAGADYWQAVNDYKAAHPQAAKLGARQAFLAALAEQQAAMSGADTSSGTTAAQELDALLAHGTVSAGGGLPGPLAQKVTQALAYPSQIDLTYVVPALTVPDQWVVTDFVPAKGLWYAVTGDHHVTWQAEDGTTGEMTPGAVLEMAKPWVSAKQAKSKPAKKPKPEVPPPPPPAPVVTEPEPSTETPGWAQAAIDKGEPVFDADPATLPWAAKLPGADLVQYALEDALAEGASQYARPSVASDGWVVSALSPAQVDWDGKVGLASKAYWEATPSGQVIYHPAPVAPLKVEPPAAEPDPVPPATVPQQPVYMLGDLVGHAPEGSQVYQSMSGKTVFVKFPDGSWHQASQTPMATHMLQPATTEVSQIEAWVQSGAVKLQDPGTPAQQEADLTTKIVHLAESLAASSGHGLSHTLGLMMADAGGPNSSEHYYVYPAQSGNGWNVVTSLLKVPVTVLDSSSYYHVKYDPKSPALPQVWYSSEPGAAEGKLDHKAVFEILSGQHPNQSGQAAQAPGTVKVTMHSKEVASYPAGSVVYTGSQVGADHLAADNFTKYVKTPAGAWWVVSSSPGAAPELVPGGFDNVVKVGQLIPVEQAKQAKAPEPLGAVLAQAAQDETAKQQEAAAEAQGAAPEQPPGVPLLISGKATDYTIPPGATVYMQKGYSSTNFFVKLADGSWKSASTYSLSPMASAIYAKYDSLLQQGKLTEVPLPTPADLAQAKDVAEFRKSFLTSAVQPFAAATGWEGPVARTLLTGIGVYGHIVYVSPAGTGGKWEHNFHKPDDSGEWVRIDKITLTGTHHSPGGPDQPLTFAQVKAAIQANQVLNAVNFDDKVEQGLGTGPTPLGLAHFGNHYKAKGTAYLEVLGNTGGGPYGYHDQYKYGSAGQATFIYHNPQGNTKNVTPTWAYNWLKTATSHYPPGEVKDFGAPVIKATPALAYATVAGPHGGQYLLVPEGSTDIGDYQQLAVKPDGSAMNMDAGGMHLVSGEVTAALKSGAVVDQYGNTVLRPGLQPAAYHLFGAPLSAEQLAAFVQVVEQNFEDKSAISAALKSLPGFQPGLAQGWTLARLQPHATWTHQRDGILALGKLMQQVPDAKAAAEAAAATAPAFLKGLPPGITGPHDVLSLNALGQAKPYGGNDLPATSTLPLLTASILGASIKAISAEFGNGKVVGTHPSSLSKDEKVAWLQAWQAGNMATVFAFDASGGKVSPAHPGAPDNTSTHQITWAPWAEGQAPAGQIPEGAWWNMANPPTAAEVSNYLIKIGMQHAEMLTLPERRQLAKAHRAGDQHQVDGLTKIAFGRADAHDTWASQPLAWTDSIKPATAYDLMLEDKAPAGEWPIAALEAFLQDNTAEATPYATETADLPVTSLGLYHQRIVVQAVLDARAAAIEAELRRPRYTKVDAVPGTIADQFGHVFFFTEGTDTKAPAVAKLAQLFGYRTPQPLAVTLETGEKGLATPKLEGHSLAQLYPSGTIDFSQFSPAQLGQVSAEHVLDWVLDNPGSHPGTMVVGDLTDTITGVDKSAAFTWKLGPVPGRAGTTTHYFHDVLGHTHWGERGGAGLLFQYTDTNGVTRYLLQERAQGVQHGGTWSIPGGARDLVNGQTETPEQAAARETEEELGALPAYQVLKVDTEHHGTEGEEGHWSYATVHALVPGEFTPEGKGSHGFEAAGTKWVTAAEMADLKLHPGFQDTARKLGASIPETSAEPPGRWSLGGEPAGANTDAQLVTTQLYQAIKAGQVSQELADFAYTAAIKSARRVASLPESVVAQQLDQAFGKSLSAPSVSSVLKRKKWLEDDFHRLWKGIYAARGWELPEVPSEALTRGLHSGFTEPTFFDHVMAAKNAGAPAFFTGTELEDNHFLVWTEKVGDNRIISGESAARGEALDKLVAWAEAHQTAGQHKPVAAEAGVVGDAPVYRKRIIVAAKAVSRHAADQIWTGPATSAALIALAEAKKSLTALVKQAEKAISDGEGSATWTKLASGTGHPELVLSMANHYLGQVGQVETAKAEHGTFQPGDLPKWEAPTALKDKAGPAQPALIVERRKAFRTLNAGQKLSTETHDEYGQDPTGATRILGEKDGELHLGTKTYEYPGEAWYVHLPTGEVIEINDGDKTGTQAAHTGRIRFKAVASDGSASLARIQGQLQAMGLKLEEATMPAMELAYWRLLSHILADRKDRATGKHGKVWETLHAYAKEHSLSPGPSITASTGSPALHKVAASIHDAGLPEQEEIALWRSAWAHLTSAAQVEDFAAREGFLPHLGHFDVKHPEITGGKPYWYRFDADAGKLAGNELPQHTLSYKAKTEVSMHVAQTGQLASTEARLRTLGIWRPGQSSVGDMAKGSSGTVFIRLNQETQGDVLLNPRVQARIHTYGFNKDNWGQTSLRPTQSYFDLAQAAANSASDNETNIKDSISFLDDIEMLQVTAPVRAKLLKEFKAAGVTTIRGLPVEDRIVTSISAVGRKKVKDALKASAPEMLAHPAEHYVPPISAHVSASQSVTTTAAEQDAQKMSHVGTAYKAVVDHSLGAPDEKINKVYYQQPGVDPGIKDPSVRGKLKGAVAKRVAAAMSASSEDIVALGKAAGMHPQEFWGPDDRTRFVAALIGAWATGSSSSAVMAMQNRARKLFGLPKDSLPAGFGTGAGFDKVGTEEEAAALESGWGAVLDEFLATMWRLTQEDLKAAGITHVTLHRLMKFDEATLPAWAKAAAGEIIDTPAARPFSSWAISKAAIFTDMVWGKGKPVLVKTTVPIELLLSYPRSGIGAYPQGEFLVLDSHGHWEIEALDAQGHEHWVEI